MRPAGLYNLDCMDALKEYPDDYFDLAIADPPYGAGLTENGGCKGWFTKYHQKNSGGGVQHNLRFHGGDRWNRYKTLRIRDSEVPQELSEQTGSKRGNTKKIVTWDIAPDNRFFEELFRVSRNQIIWGGNYFELPPTRCFLIWRKLTISEKFSMAMCEYAWTSFNSNAKLFECTPQGTAADERFHPTQKPVKLYEWILNNYAKPGDKILDPMAGSGTCLVACRNLGFECTGFEIDEEYYTKAQERIKKNAAQINIFDLMKGGLDN